MCSFPLYRFFFLFRIVVDIQHFTILFTNYFFMRPLLNIEARPLKVNYSITPWTSEDWERRAHLFHFLWVQSKKFIVFHLIIRMLKLWPSFVKTELKLLDNIRTFYLWTLSGCDQCPSPWEMSCYQYLHMIFLFLSKRLISAGLLKCCVYIQRCLEPLSWLIIGKVGSLTSD